MHVQDLVSGLEIIILCNRFLYIFFISLNYIRNLNRNAGKPVGGRVTNNVGEIQASIYAIKIAKNLGIEKLCISTDSQFLIKSITMWIKGWKAKNWRLKNGDPVKNVVDFKELDSLLSDGQINIKWVNWNFFIR